MKYLEYVASSGACLWTYSKSLPGIECKTRDSPIRDVRSKGWRFGSEMGDLTMNFLWGKSSFHVLPQLLCFIITPLGPQPLMWRWAQGCWERIWPPSPPTGSSTKWMIEKLSTTRDLSLLFSFLSCEWAPPSPQWRPLAQLPLCSPARPIPGTHLLLLSLPHIYF